MLYNKRFARAFFAGCLLLNLSCLSSTAQTYQLTDKLPLDREVRAGKLPNGLSYFIRKNAIPKDRVELRLVVNAGSVLEDDDQQGLAHFVEHMAFNGTTHFAKNDLISYLQSVGVKFGSDLNAYTSFDETVYKLQVPTDNAEILKKAFVVLEDWAHGITFKPAEIEGERGVITEEWRIGQGAAQRMRDTYLPVVYNQSRYAERLPIGKMEVVQHFKPDVLKRFYKDWYRPDLMAVVVVGDVNPDQIETMIRQGFAQLRSPVKKRERVQYDIPRNTSALYTVATDKEATASQILVYSKFQGKKDSTLADYRGFILRQLYQFAVNQRLNTRVRTTDAAYSMVHTSFQSLSRNCDAFTVAIRLRENSIEKGLKAVFEELERVKRFGFTESELERAKKGVTLKYERAYRERDKSSSDGYASELIRHYLNAEAVPGISFEYGFLNNQLPSITLKELNEFDDEILTNSDRVVVVTAPDKAGLSAPSEAGFAAIEKEVAGSFLEPYEDKVVKFEWQGKKPDGGTIVKEVKDVSNGVTTFLLSNGAKVILKPTDFKNDEVYGYAYSPGGLNLCGDDDYFSALYASAIVGESGVPGLSKTDMIKAFAGKELTVTPYISSTSEGFNLKCNPRDLENMFQLLNIYFTRPSLDTLAARLLIQRTASNLVLMKQNPQKYFEDKVARELAQKNFRGGGLPDTADLKKVNYRRAFEIFQQRFANAGDFSFVFVGSFDPDSIRSLICTYIAGLPTQPEYEKVKDIGIRPPVGNYNKSFYRGVDMKSAVNLIFSGKAKFSEKESYLLSSLVDVLNIRLLESLREKKSGVYGVRAAGRVAKYPYENYQVKISFQCAPSNVDSLTQAALAEIEKIKKSGVLAADLLKVKESQKRKLEVDVKRNAYWLNELVEGLIYQQKTETVAEQLKEIENLSSEALQKLARNYLTSDYARFVLYPESFEK